MIRVVQRFVGGLLCLITGCTAAPPPQTGHTTLFVPGVFGDGWNYDGLRNTVAEGGSTVKTVDWGWPKPLFIVNFSNRGVHDGAEEKLSKAIDATTGPVDLVGHSAGCGVILGALAKAHRDVGHVVLIAPSVSPGYDLRSALTRLTTLDVFYSKRDTVFLEWRCSHFGTYDDVKIAAAGYSSFTTIDPKLTQHAYDPVWEKLGNDGGHGGGTNGAFVKAVIVPLLRSPLPVLPGEG